MSVPPESTATVGDDTIHALSSGPPPSGVAVIRISGTKCFTTLGQLLGNKDRIPHPRAAMLRSIFAAFSGKIIDRGLILAFPGPHSFTGEDSAELHLHGSPAVVAATLRTLADLGSRPADAGEFTRRAFRNGRIDLTQAEALADLIDAETETQRELALANSSGRLRDRVEGWRERLILLLAEIEADLDFSDEADVTERNDHGDITALAADIRTTLAAAPIAERIRHGLRIVIAGPPNAGKSSLLNALLRRNAAIVTPIPGTTRDSIEARLDLAGRAATLVDTAGLRDTTDPIEREGIARTHSHIADADLVLDLGSGKDHPNSLHIINKIDISGEHPGIHNGRAYISARSGLGLADLEQWLTDWASRAIPTGEPPLVTHARHRDLLLRTCNNLDSAAAEGDAVLRAEHLRQATGELGRLTGRISPEEILDQIFGRFCIGK